MQSKLNRTRLPIAIGLLIPSMLGSAIPVVAQEIVVDDFSISQVGISTNQTAAFDSLISPYVLGGRRTLWGGGGSYPGNCASSECKTEVAEGQMLITPGADCGGTGTVTWSGIDSGSETIFANSLNLDVSHYLGIQIEISNIVGSVETLFTISSGGYYGHLFENRVKQRKVMFDSPGKHLIPFSGFTGGTKPIDFTDLDHITMSAYADVGEFVAFDVVRIVPEPSTVSTLILLGFSRLFQRERRIQLLSLIQRKTSS
jgi:hypothetical protein